MMSLLAKRRDIMIESPAATLVSLHDAAITCKDLREFRDTLKMALEEG